MLNSRYSQDEEERAIATLIGHHAEAMILAGIDQTDRARKLLEGSGVPVVQTMEIAEKPIDINIGMSQRGAVMRRRGSCSISVTVRLRTSRRGSTFAPKGACRVTRRRWPMRGSTVKAW